MGDAGGGEAVVLEGAGAAAVTTGVVDGVADGDGVAAADEGAGVGAMGLEGASITGAVGGSTLGSHPISAIAATETSAAEERPPRRLVSGRRLVPQKTQAASFERT
jgi:hypothetical protein